MNLIGSNVRPLPLLVAAAAVFSAGFAVCLQTPASAQAEGPELVSAQTTVRMEVKEPGFADTGQSGTASGSLLISNQGTATAAGIQVSGIYSNGAKFEPTATSEDGALASLEVDDHLVILLSFSWNSDLPDTGTFVVESQNGPPLTVPFGVRQTTAGSVFGWAAFWSALAAIILTVVAYATLEVPDFDTPAKVARPPVSRPIFPAASWSFTGSLASSLTAVGAILGLFLAASGFLSEVLPGLSTGVFVAANIGFLLVIALAAVAYKASHDGLGRPTYLALLIATGVTLWAVIGELVALAVLVGRGGLPAPWIWIAGGVIIVLLALFVRSSTLEVLRAPQPVKESSPPPAVVVVVGGSGNPKRIAARVDQIAIAVGKVKRDKTAVTAEQRPSALP